MKCIFCGKEIKSNASNSCWPIYTDVSVRCCNNCNMSKIIPARFAMMKKEVELQGIQGKEV